MARSLQRYQPLDALQEYLYTNLLAPQLSYSVVSAAQEYTLDDKLLRSLLSGLSGGKQWR